MKKRISSIVMAVLTLSIILSGMVYAATWEYKFPIEITDTGGTARTYLPVDLGITPQNLVTAGKISSDGLDTDIQVGGTSIKYMLSTTKAFAVIPSLPASGKQTANLYTGYAPLQTNFPIIVGPGGYITTTDAPALEPGDTFQIDVSGYVDTSAGENKYILYKEDAINICIDNATDGTINSTYQDTINDSYYASASSGYITNSTQWSDDWAGANGTDKNTNDIIVGSDMSVANSYKWHRGYVIFDTSLIPDDKDILSATLYLYGEQDASTTDFSVVIQSGQPTYPHDPLVLGDYDKSNYSGDGGSLNTSSFTTSGYNSISLNETGIAWINKTGTTKFCLRGSQDIAHTPAAGQAQYVRFYSQEYAGTSRDPYLVITYKNEYTVEAIDIDSGEHVIRISADATDFKLFVDDMDTPEDTISIIGSTVEDNANNWLIDQNNVMPYMDYFKLAVGGVELIEYQPVAMLTATTLLNEDNPGTYNGAITYGTNSNLTISYGEMDSYGSTTAAGSGVDEGYTPDSADMPSGWYASGSSLSSLPFYDAFYAVSLQTGQPVQTMYLLACVGLAFALFLVLAMTTRSALLGVLAMDIVLFVGSSMTILPGWIPFAIVVVQIGIMYLYRQVVY